MLVTYGRLRAKKTLTDSVHLPAGSRVSWTTGGKSLQVFVHGANRTRQEFWVRESDTLSILLCLIAAENDIPEDELHLQHASRILNRDYTFDFYSIQPGTELTLLRTRLATSSSRRLTQERRLPKVLLKRPAGHDAGSKAHRLRTILSRPSLNMASEDDPGSNMDGVRDETDKTVCWLCGRATPRSQSLSEVLEVAVHRTCK